MPVWMVAVFAIQIILACGFLVVAWFVGGTYPMPRPVTPQQLIPFALPLLIVFAAFLLCRALLRNGRIRMAAMCALAPLGAALGLAILWTL